MNPGDIIAIGPLAVAADRLVALALTLVFVAGVDHLAARFARGGGAVARPGTAMAALLAGLVAARAAHVWIHRASFALDPVAALFVWLGGWWWPAGVAAAALILVVMLRGTAPRLAGLGLLAALSAGWALLAGQPSATAPLRLPADLPITMVEGGTVPAGALRGRPLVLNLWASWCPPCRREMPMLVAAAARERRARIILVNQGEAAGRVHAFLAAEALSPRAVALDPTGRIGALVGAPALPTTLIVGADGAIRQVHVGELSRVQLDIALRAAGGALD
ncbi:MAG: TlpA family protein disulfide reductase [Sphingomonadales bacterium]|nr:TlpA family protein disulfide reductase [Sphingomonadales bacterium]